MKDFFVSYNREDRQWAEWIAWELEEAGCSVVIQSWDFTGNWVLAMDRAMKETARTIAVLSPSYVAAFYTHPEWANAFRLDPTGEKDLLIPVRVRPVELEGVLAQVSFLDLVGSSEGDARTALLRRVRGERRKPAQQGAFPGAPSAGANAVRHQAVAARPVYPAADEDIRRAIRARALLVAWRSRHAAEADALETAGRQARGWSRTLPERFDDAVAAVIGRAARAAADLRALPVRELEFAAAYGLAVHPTVFWGQALDDVLTTHESYGPGRSSARRQFDELRRRNGLAVAEMPDGYAFEMAARVLESAHALTRFNLDALPRGYLPGVAPAPGEDLSAHRALLLARVNDDPRLHVLAAGESVRSLAVFAARSLPLAPLCAWVNGDGTIDLVASDDEYVYGWSRSTPQPSMQYPHGSAVLAASRTGSPAHPELLTLHSDGSVRLHDAHGGACTVLQGPPFSSGALWTDPLEPERWIAFGLDRDSHLVSLDPARADRPLTVQTLWDGAAFGSGSRVSWYSRCEASPQRLDGLPCILTRRQASGGEGVHFLDPLSLAPLRPPLFVPGFVSDLVVAAGRWLVAVFLQRGKTVLPRIEVRDLHAAADEPVARCHEREGDVYTPLVVEEAGEAFELFFVLRPLGGGMRSLCRFRWPSGDVFEVEHYAELRLAGVTPAPQARFR